MVLVCALIGRAQGAPLEQPNGAVIPSQMGCDGGQPTGLASVFACQCEADGVCNIGAPCPGNMDPADCDDGQNGTCETTIWHAWNDDACVPTHRSGLDPWTDGMLLPETFQPTCPLTFTVVSRGTAKFHDAFGWYNVGDGPPAASDLHVMIDCSDPPGTQVTLDLAADPAWQGGEVGFFLLTPEDHGARGQCAGGDCCAAAGRLPGAGWVYYSQRDFNPDAAGPDSFIHLVVYDSRIADRTFYFAWEDIHGGDNNDFTDLVTSVSGVECSGGGTGCDTGQPGACGPGLTVCAGSALECVALRQPETEICNQADDDCDGTVDEDTTCSDDVCSACCAGVQCPEGESCRNGACVDPCAGVDCAAGEVCREGLCFPGCNSCGGIVCNAGVACGLDGECVDSGSGDGGSGGDGDGDGDGDGGGGAGDGEAGGCGCQNGSGGSAWLLPLLLTLLHWTRRRRGRHASRPCGSAQ